MDELDEKTLDLLSEFIVRLAAATQNAALDPKLAKVLVKEELLKFKAEVENG